jgi:GlpG protein
MIGHLPDEASARTFGDYLLVQGMENQLEHDGGQGWAVWIRDEDKLAAAGAALAEFTRNPKDPRYQAQGRSAGQVRAQAEKDQVAYEKRLKSRRHLFRPLTEYGFGLVTFILIAFSVAVFVLSSFGRELEPIAGLFITDWMNNPDWRNLPEIHQGQLWRLVTPIFIHFGPLHILFNLLWLGDLGSMIEGRQSSWVLLALTLVIGAGSNLAEFFMSSPNFGGMSGVVYGLLGYIWIRGKFDPGSGLFLHPSTVTMMLVWFVVCWTGIMHIANFAHTAGLLMGVAWGYLSSLRYR